MVSHFFAQMDKDDDEKVNISDFIDVYHAEYTQLQEEIEEMELRVKD